MLFENKRIRLLVIFINADFTAILIQNFAKNESYANRWVKLQEIITPISIRRIFGTFQTLQIFFGTCLVFIKRIIRPDLSGRIFLLLRKFQRNKVSDFCFCAFQYISINVCCYTYVAMSEVFGYDFQVNTAVQ